MGWYLRNYAKIATTSRVLLLSFLVSVVCIACDDHSDTGNDCVAVDGLNAGGNSCPQITAPALVIDISADDVPNSTKQDTTMSIYTCRTPYATCSSTALLTAKLPVGIDIRGNTSTLLNKKNYGIETRNIHGFDRDYPLFGMPVESDWALYAGGYDPSMLANSVTFEIYRSIFNRYAPRTRYVNLYLQTEYWGLYVLMERIKVGADRVNIRKLTPNDRFGVAVTGGYILRIGRVSQTATAITTRSSTVFEVYAPNSDDIVHEQVEYLQRYLNDVESAIIAATSLAELAQWVDIYSLVDHMLIHELTYNKDSYVFSTYLYKQHNDQKLYFGPLWDFDLAHGLNSVPDRESQKLIIHIKSKLSLKRINIWKLLWKHEFVREVVVARWRELRHTGTISVDLLHNYFDEQVELMMGMQYRDFLYWERSKGHEFLRDFKPQSHVHMIEYMKDFMSGQVAWLDECFSVENERNYCS